MIIDGIAEDDADGDDIDDGRGDDNVGDKDDAVNIASSIRDNSVGVKLRRLSSVSVDGNTRSVDLVLGVGVVDAVVLLLD